MGDAEKSLIKRTVSKFDLLRDVDVSRKEGPDCVISFRTTFGKDSAYDLELTKGDSGYEAVLLTSSETPLMQDRIDALDENRIDSLFDHVIETLRELEGN